VKKAEHIAGSQKPEAGSDLASDNQSRLPLSVYRLPLVTSYDKQSTHARFTVIRLHGQRRNGRPTSQKPKAKSQQPAAILRLTIKAEHTNCQLPIANC
jgi:hypothetical protein